HGGAAVLAAARRGPARRTGPYPPRPSLPSYGGGGHRHAHVSTAHGSLAPDFAGRGRPPLPLAPVVARYGRRLHGEQPAAGARRRSSARLRRATPTPRALHD